MTVTQEEIMAYVDGELDDATRGRVTLAALADLDLADRIAAERALRERLKAHFAPVVDEPVPAAWVESIRAATPPAPVINLAAERARRAAPAPRWRTPAWAGAAMAACLAIGVFVGSQWHGGGQGPIVVEKGALVASGDLGRALDTQLASADGGGADGHAPIRMLGTFHREGGDLCRVFAGAQASGIACHDGGQWQLQHVLPGSAPAEQTAYRQAGSQDGALMALAQTMAQGDPLDATQEKAAKDKGWR
ncbi:anti-sigma factor family protein [Novosphingobium rosa]|uniref:anti-sigma factor family protein n=1 Tax=Novosphingobium rosa TaxID=76978 RepID=UPI00082A8ECE|nr:anti-sigma factor [Novosphingobium rosa]